MATIDTKDAGKKADQVWKSAMKVWGRALTLVVFVLATTAVLRACGLMELAGYLPGARVGMMDLMLVCGMVAAARFSAGV